jgi:hypothetical protein
MTPNLNLIFFLPYIGGLVLIFVVGVLVLGIFKKVDNLNHKSLLFLVCVGLILLFSTRMTEFSLFGMLHAKLQQANNYLIQIQQIREQANQTKVQLENEIRKYTDYFNELSIVDELEASSLADNRQAFEELQRISLNGKYKAIAVSNVNAVEKQLEDIKNFMSVSTSAYRFSSDGRNYLPIECFSVNIILFQYFNLSGITLDQILEATKVINTKIKKMPEQEVVTMFLKFLKHSKNLPASSAVCEILAEKYNAPIDIFDFNTWVGFLNKRIGKSK